MKGSATPIIIKKGCQIKKGGVNTLLRRNLSETFGISIDYIHALCLCRTAGDASFKKSLLLRVIYVKKKHASSDR